MNKPVALIVSDHEEGAGELIRAIDAHGAFETMAARGRMMETLVANGHQGLVVFDCDVLGEEEVHRLLDVAGRIEQGTVLILASQISIFAYRHVAKMNNLVTLQKPFSKDLFHAVLGRLAASVDMASARFPRFITDEPVRMVVLKTGLLIPTRMKNYSAGGAFLEYRGISLKVGDTIQLNVGNGASYRPTHGLQIKARVVWIQDGVGPRSPSRGVGIQFLES